MSQPRPAVQTAAGVGGGVLALVRGLRMWGSRPKLMLLGAVPALIVGAAFLTLLVVLTLNLDGLAGWMTPFADDWSEGARTLLRLTLGIAVLAGAVALVILLFTAVTLAVGDPFYERIWRAVEDELGGMRVAREPRFRDAVADSLALGALALVTGLVVAVVGLVPVVGGVVGAVLGFLISGRLLARELLARPLEARGITGAQRAPLVKANRAMVWGFGLATQACFLIPFGAVFVMPAAVVGATIVARRMLREPV